MPPSSLGPTTTTTNDPMVASTTSRPSAAPTVEQPLDHLQPPGDEGDVKRLQDIEPPEFRLRVGDYRARFHDFGDAVEVTGVKHRREAYR